MPSCRSVSIVPLEETGAVECRTSEEPDQLGEWRDRPLLLKTPGAIHFLETGTPEPRWGSDQALLLTATHQRLTLYERDQVPFYANSFGRSFIMNLALLQMKRVGLSQRLMDYSTPFRTRNSAQPLTREQLRRPLWSTAFPRRSWTSWMVWSFAYCRIFSFSIYLYPQMVRLTFFLPGRPYHQYSY